MRRFAVPTLKALPFVVGVGMYAYGGFASNSDLRVEGHLWILTGMSLWLIFGMRRLLSDWPLGELLGVGFEAGKKHRRRTASTLRAAPPADEALPNPRHTRGRFKA